MMTGNHVIDYWDGLSRWGARADAANLERIRATLDLVPHDVRTALDVGCGDGTVSNPLVGGGRRVVGVDISAVALSHFAGTALASSTDALPFADRAFDLVVCAEVLEHLPADIYERTLGELERVSRRYILITTPNQEYLPEGFVQCAHCGCNYHMNLHVRTFDESMHRNLFRRFRPLETIGIGHWTHSPGATAVRHNVLGVYREKDGVVCPCCGCGECRAPDVGALGRLILRTSRRFERTFASNRKSRWLASLYVAKSAAE